MTARKLATPTNAELDANPERLRIVAKSNVEKAFYEADSKERITACLNTTTIRVLAAMLGELTGKSYNPEDACKEYWVARVAEYFIHIRKVRLHEKIRTHSITEIQNNPAFSQLQDLVGGMGYTTAYAILRASAAKDLKAMCKAFNLKNISRLNQKRIYAQLLVDFADEYWLLYSDFDERNNDSQPELPATADDAISANDNDTALASQPAAVASTQSEKNAQPEIIKFVVGKSYGNGMFSVVSRSAQFITFKWPSGKTFSRKTTVKENRESVIVKKHRRGYLWTLEAEPDTFQKIAHAEIAHTEKYTFIPGMTYFYTLCCDHSTKHYCKIIARTEKTITFHRNNDSEFHKAKIRSDNGTEWFLPDGNWAYAPTVSAKNIVQPEITATAEIAQPEFISPYDYDINAMSPNTAPITPSAVKNSALLEVSQPDALYMDDSYSDAPGDNSECARNQDFPVDFPECTHAEITQPDLSAPIDNNPLHHLKPCPNCRSTHIPFLKRCDDNNFSTATRRFNGGIARQHIYYRLKCRDCGHEVKATIYRTGLGRFVIPHQNDADVKNEVCQAWNKQYDDNPGITIVPSDEIEKPDYTVYPEPIIDECPYVSVPACDIPENHNSAAAVVPHVNPITAATMRLASNLAALLFVVCKIIIPLMFMRKKDLKKANTDTFLFTVGYKYVALFHDKRQFITISDRHTDKYGFTWLSFYDEDNISYNARVKLRDDGYTELLDFKELERTCYAFEGFKPIKESNRVKYIKFEVGRSYTAKRDSFGEHREFHITVLERFSAVSCNNVKSKNKIICLKVCATDSNEQNKSVTGWIHAYVNRDIHAEEFTRLPNLILRADQPDSVQTVPAEIYDITPETKAQPKSRKHEHAPASDIEHKLIETKDLHFSERRKALDHNAAVISSCMFSEAIICLLSSISLQAILQLGFHMRLFIAKPKGKKNVIAELFAKRLIDSRELRPNVRSTSDNINTKNTAPVPDNVKFVQLKNRQLGFIFTE